MASSIPKATHTGTLKIGDLELPCAVLEDGRRVFSHRGIMAALQRTRRGDLYRRRKPSLGGEHPLPVFVSARNLEPFIPDTLRVALTQPILYHPQHGGKAAYGVEATHLGDICRVWRDAYQADALLPVQEHIGVRAQILLDGLVGVAIVALVDEATGYQEQRDRDELHRILDAYIAEELRPWAKCFPDEYYRQLFRLRGWSYSPLSVSRPQYVGTLTNEFVYERLPNGVLAELRRRNPPATKGRRRFKHHQFLTADIGNPHLERHLAAVTALMRAAPNWGVFRRLIERAFPHEAHQIEFPLEDIDTDDTTTVN